MTITWQGEFGTVNETGVTQDGMLAVRIDEKYFRLIEVDLLLGDSSKAVVGAELKGYHAARDAGEGDGGERPQAVRGEEPQIVDRERVG